MIYKSIDLFAGIGGIRLGFELAFNKNIETVYASEWDLNAQKTYLSNFSDTAKIDGDITKVDESKIPKFDICLAGFPCQAFSIAGKRKGFEDDYKGSARGTLFFDVLRICEFHKPMVVFAENVKGLLSHDKGRTFKVILGSLNELGYTVFHQVLNSKDFGVPQNRERIYIVAFRNDLNVKKFDFPSSQSIDIKLKDILEDNIPWKYFLSEQYLNTLINHKNRHKEKGNGFGYEIRSLDSIAGAVVCGGMGRERNLIVDNRKVNHFDTIRSNLKLNDKNVRKLTPRELARLQGFPDTFIFPVADTHLYKQLGNTVTVPVVHKIALQIFKELKNA